MTYNSVRETVLKALSNVGIFIENSDDDLDLRDFITDSIEFISFIVELENTLDIEIHDDLLQIEAVASLNVFCYRILNILQDKANKLWHHGILVNSSIKGGEQDEEDA